MPLAEPDQIVADVATAVALAEGEDGVRAVVGALTRLEPVSVRALGRAVDLPVPIVAAICGELRKRGVVAEERPAQLTVAGRRLFARGAIELDTRCASCGGRGIALPESVARLRRGLAQVADLAPHARPELDQCHCTPKTKLRRVLALHAAGALSGRRILLLGDDDLMAVALARFVRHTGAPDAITALTVVDIDSRLLDYIDEQLHGAAFPVRLVEHDLRDPLPAEHTAAYDTVVTDPPYTAAGGTLFLSRAVEAAAAPGSQLCVSFGSRRPGVQLELQLAIARMALEIRALTRDFNDYVGAGVLGGTSHLYHLATTPESRPLVTRRADEPIYTAASSRRRTASTPSTSPPRARRSAAAP